MSKANVWYYLTKSTKQGRNMKHFYDAAALSGSGVAMGGGLSDNTIIGIIGLVIAVCFGIFGAWLRWRDSKALHKALEDGNIREAMRIRSK